MPSVRRRSLRGTILDRILTTDDLVTSDNCFFAATGITDGKLLRGVRYGKDIVTTQSLVMRVLLGHCAHY